MTATGMPKEMKKPIIAVAIDIFCPGAYRAPAWPAELGPAPGFLEDYAHEKDYVYVVLQPLLFRGAADAEKGFAVAAAADPADYFRPGRKLDAGDVVFADEKMAQSLPVGVEAVPTSLPPGTRISLELMRGNARLWTSSQREIGLAGLQQVPPSPFLVALEGEVEAENDWPALASLNFAHPLANAFSELDASQREQVYVWLTAVAMDLLRYKEKPGSLSRAQEDALDLLGLEVPKPTPAEMHSHLVDASRGERMYDRLLLDEPAQQKELRLSAPRFKVVDAGAFARRIRAEIGASLPDDSTHASYLHVWWHAMCKEAARAGASEAWADITHPSELAGALGRYFGFGERLRWPLPAFDVTAPSNEAFMVPCAQSAGGRFETNAVSLCELVFRVPVAVLGGDPKGLVARLSVAGQVRDDSQQPHDAHPLAPQLAQVTALASQWQASATCRAQVRRDDCDEDGKPLHDGNGIVMVQPRAAKCVPLDNPKAADLFSVAGVLLDLADNSSRHGLGEGGEGLVPVREPRRALLPEECLAFEPALMGETRWRIKGHLRAAQVATVPAEPPLPRVYEFVAARLSSTAVRGVAAGVANSEAGRFKELLPELLAGAGRFKASLWLPNGAGIVDLKDRLVDADGPDSDLRFYVLDDDPATGIGSVLPAPGDGAPDAFQVALVIEVVPGQAGSADAQRWLPFNAVRKTGADVPWVALNRSALSRVSRSVDRWMERFHVTPVVDGAPNADDPLHQHLSNFNKLRVFCASDGGNYVPVTYPDAAVPLAPTPAGKYRDALPWERGWPQQPPFSYFVGHLYSQENATERPKVGSPDSSQDRVPEALRYVRYRRADAAAQLAGYVEHQYSYRIPILQKDFTADARLATDLRSAAALVARGKGIAADAAAGISEQEGKKMPLLEVRIVDGANALEIAGRADYFVLAFEAEFRAESVQGDGRTPHVETLRNIYEAVRDFLHALDGSGASLHAELFRFDNSLPRADIGRDDAQSIPARLDRFVTGELPLKPGSGVGAALRAGLARLAPASFEKFQQEVNTLRFGGSSDVFAPVRLAMDDADWTWIEGTAPTSPPDLRALANVVRLALDLQRPAELVIAPSAAEGRFIPFSSASDPSIPGWIEANVQQVVARAREELATLLQRPAQAGEGSSLYRRREWLCMQPPSGEVVVEQGAPVTGAGTHQASKESREGRWRMIFGDYASTVLVPPGTMRQVTRVAEMFYVPMAFRPLAAHPTLATGNDTLSFAQFLLGVVGDLLAGRPPADILLQPSTIGKASDDGARARVRLEHLLTSPGGIASALEQLIHAVHNAADLQHDPEKKLTELTKRALALWDSSQVARSASVKALLGQRPELFASSRAIGVVMFDPVRFARPLQSVQICKRISQKAATEAEALIDVDRFVIPPTPSKEAAVLLDPLEAALYDTEFELPMNRYKLPDGSESTDAIYDSPIELDQVTLAWRGGTSGRTGEDFLESEHHFPVVTDHRPVGRGVEVDAPHWNPRWAYAMAGAQTGTERRLYLLPSRRFPAAPVLLQVAAQGGAGPVNTSEINLTPTAAGDDEQVFLNALDESLSALNALHLVIRNDDGHTAADAPAWKISAGTATVKHQDADGWYRIDTFLEHHYFMVEADETGDEPFANEVFEIDVHVNRDGTMPEAASQNVPDGAPSIAPSPLLQAFRRWQQAQGEGSRETAVPPQPAQNEAMSLPALVESVAYWLCESVADPAQVPAQERVARGSESVLKPMAAPREDQTPVNFRAAYECAAPEPTLTVNVVVPSPDPASRRIGSVVQVSMFKPVAGAVPASVRGERAILRVSMLADPWSRVRLRMRQVRNRRDVAGGAPDIDPVFEMQSAYSSWSAYSHAEKIIDAQYFKEAQVPPSERRLEITSVGLEDWIAKPSTKIDPVVATRLRGVIPEGRPYAGKPYWNAAEMLDQNRKVSVVLRQRLPDRHMLHDGAAWHGLRQRDLSVPRYVFGIIAASSVDEQLGAVAATTITAGEPELEITWLDKSSGGPVYRITWPVRFLK